VSATHGSRNHRGFYPELYSRAVPVAELPAARTPLTRDATAAALVPAYVRVFGAPPDRSRAELLLAQVWLENANGQSIIDHNIGNLTTSATSGADYWRPPWFDLDAVNALPDTDPNKARYLSLNARMQAGTAPSAFRAFDTFDQGFDAWLHLLATPAKAPILAAASSGDADAFAKAIFDTGYCPDPECKAAGPSYLKLRDQIRAASYFDGLDEQKKKQQATELPGFWFWCWGRLLALRTSGRVTGGVERSLWGEP
jgi:hypothetical protein